MQTPGNIPKGTVLRTALFDSAILLPPSGFLSATFFPDMAGAGGGGTCRVARAPQSRCPLGLMKIRCELPGYRKKSREVSLWWGAHARRFSPPPWRVRGVLSVLSAPLSVPILSALLLVAHCVSPGSELPRSPSLADRHRTDWTSTSLTTKKPTLISTRIR